MTVATSVMNTQRGSALLAALFLIIVLAALGAFAVRLGADQQQTTSLQLLQDRATAAANAGLDYWAFRIANDAVKPSCTVPPPATLSPGGNPGLNGFTVYITCTKIASGSAWVYEITSEARSSAAYGSPDFVRRELKTSVKTW